MLTREELNEKLDKLRESRIEDGSYDYVKPVNAMCYSMDFQGPMTIQRYCRKCKKFFDIRTTEHYNVFYDFENMVESFHKAGVGAELFYLCPDCIKKERHELEFSVLAYSKRENGRKPYLAVSYPRVDYFDADIDLRRTSTLHDYELVLMFLSGNHTYPSFINYENYSHEMRDYGVDKYAIDRALHYILGFDIKYDKKEAIKQFDSYICQYVNYIKNRDELNLLFKLEIDKLEGDSISFEQYEDILIEFFELY